MFDFLPETREALDEIVSMGDPTLDEALLTMGEVAGTIVPDLVGLSLSMLEDGLTFTVVAKNTITAVLDAAQYVDGGPCVEMVADPSEPLETHIDDLLDEGRWALSALASAAVGVASSLSMALVDQTGVVGGINLYGSSADAFSGRHAALASALGAEAETIVTNADLGFTTRRRAQQAPQVLQGRAKIDSSVGILAAVYAVEPEEARRRLDSAARRAGLDLVTVADVVIQLHHA